MSIIESEFRSVILSGFILSTPFIFASDNSAFILSFIPDSSMSFCSAFVFTFHNVSINTLTEHLCSVTVPVFTFHNVSINTGFHFRWFFRQQALHSTMFLLILQTDRLRVLKELSLHSTMFLLIPIPRSTDPFLLFSLHSTMFLLIRNAWAISCIVVSRFTFHNVSINTLRSFHWVFQQTLLYIPQCFY